MGSLEGRVALVTGASRGIGRAIAKALAARGASVAAAARGENARETVEEIRAGGGTAELFSMDVTDTASVAGVIAGTLEKLGRLDILVNNAGITKDQLLLRMPQTIPAMRRQHHSLLPNLQLVHIAVPGHMSDLPRCKITSRTFCNSPSPRHSPRAFS